MKGKSCGFSEGLAGSLGLLSSCKKDLRVPLALPQGSQVSSRAEMGTLGFLSSHCRRNWPHLDSMFLSTGDRDLGVVFKVHLGSQASS